MLTQIKLNIPDHKVFAISDLHIRHARVAVKRGYADAPTHDKDVIGSVNEVCDADSYLISLGDIMSDDPTGAHTKTLLRSLSFHTLLWMPGNHESGWRALYREALITHFPEAVRKRQIMYEVYPLTMVLEDTGKTIVFLPNLTEVKTTDQLLVCSHYPIVSHNRMALRSIHLSGHSHGNCHLTNKDTGRGLRLDVGWESFKRPISVADIKHHLAGREIDAWDHHGKADAAPESP